MKRFIALFCFFLLVHQAVGQTATPTSTPPPLGDSDFLDDSPPAIHFVDYHGSVGGTPIDQYWAVATNAAAYWNGYHYSVLNSSRLYMCWNFVGDRLALYGVKGPYGDPNATLLIDGVPHSVSFYNATTQWQQIIFEIDGLDYGWHQARLNASGTGQMYIDAIHIGPHESSAATQEIYLTLIAEIVQENTAEPTPGWRSGYEIDGQAVAFDYQANAGQAAGIVFKAGILLVAILVAVVLMRGGEL